MQIFPENGIFGIMLRHTLIRRICAKDVIKGGWVFWVFWVLGERFMLYIDMLVLQRIKFFFNFAASQGIFSNHM